MPGFVKTEHDEELWEKAKDIVREQYGRSEKQGARFWRLVTSIYKRIHKSQLGFAFHLEGGKRMEPVRAPEHRPVEEPRQTASRELPEKTEKSARPRVTVADARRVARRLKIDWGKAKFTLSDFLRGMRVETEHWGGPTAVADSLSDVGRIALAHLSESPRYYEELAKMERGLEKSARRLQGRTEFQGLKVSIENRRGSVRRGKDKDGKPWETKMFWPYGYVLGAIGRDGDNLDCFIGPDPHAAMAYIVHQKRPDTGAYDEDKVMLGFDSEEAARDAFLAHYNTHKFLGEITSMPMGKFIKKVESGKYDGKMLKSLLVQVAKANPGWASQARDAKGRWAAGETGEFGPILRQFHHDAKGAVRRLRRLRSGEAVAALHHPDVGDIDLIWGNEGRTRSKGYGLAKLVKWHPEVLGDLQGHILRMRKTAENDNSIQLDSDDYHAVVRLNWQGREKRWLLTAFGKQAKQSPPSAGRTIDASDNPLGQQDDKLPCRKAGTTHTVGSSGGTSGVNPSRTYTRHSSGIQSDAGAEDSTKKSIPHCSLLVNLKDGQLLVKAYRRAHWRNTKAGKRVWVAGHNTRQRAAEGKPEYVGFHPWKRAYLKNLKPASDTLLALMQRIPFREEQGGQYWLLKNPKPHQIAKINEAWGRPVDAAIPQRLPAQTDGNYVYEVKRWDPVGILIFRTDLRAIHEHLVSQKPESMLLARQQWQPKAASLVAVARDGKLLWKSQWRESDHPRVPAGSPEGGEFTQKLEVPTGPPAHNRLTRATVNIEKTEDSLWSFAERLGLNKTREEAGTGTVYMSFAAADDEGFENSVTVRIANHASRYGTEDVSIDPSSGIRPWQVMGYLARRFGKPVPAAVRRQERLEAEYVRAEAEKRQQEIAEASAFADRSQRIEAWIKQHKPEVWAEWRGPNAVSGNQRKAGRGAKKRWDAAWGEAAEALDKSLGRGPNQPTDASVEAISRSMTPEGSARRHVGGNGPQSVYLSHIAPVKCLRGSVRKSQSKQWWEDANGG